MRESVTAGSHPMHPSRPELLFMQSMDVMRSDDAAIRGTRSR